MKDIVNFLQGLNKDIICTNVKIDLAVAIDTLNSIEYHGYTTWYWDSNLQRVCVGNKEIPLNTTVKGITLETSYYYTLSEYEAILVAQHVQGGIYAGKYA